MVKRGQLQVNLQENSRNNVFRRKQTTNKVLHKIFRGFEVINKVRLIFLGPNVIFKEKEGRNKIPLTRCLYEKQSNPFLDSANKQASSSIWS